MLQPLQLEDVAMRYKADVAEFADFFAKAGVRVQSKDALTDVALRLRQDRAFRRDLVSHVWVAVHRSAERISYPDLLGVVAMAAAGTHFATEADEGAAHEVLRFLMDARTSLAGVPGAASLVESDSALVATPPVEAVQTLPDPPEPHGWTTDPADATLALPRTVDTPRGGRRRAAWMATAVLLLSVCLTGGWLHWRSTTPSARTPAAEVSGASSQGSEGETAPQSVVRVPATIGSPAGIGRSTSKASPANVSPSSAMARSAPHDTAAPSNYVSGSALRATSPRASASAPSVDPASPFAPARATRNAPSPAGIPGAATPSSVLSQRLGSPTVPGYAATEAGGSGATSRYPRLLRRHPAGTPAPSLVDDNADTVAVNRVPADARLAGAARTGVTLPVGTVRPTSLGIMAANVLYSPAPSYPEAASAAHVQGEVKVEAEVDRDGNVTSARVVSGPPLLRDAALDAVQHWRYRPYSAAGRPVPASATAVVDFQLP